MEMNNSPMISSLDLKQTEKLFLYVLKERGADTADGLTVTLERLGEYAGVNRNTASTAMRALHKFGYIHIVLGRGKASSTIKLTL